MPKKPKRPWQMRWKVEQKTHQAWVEDWRYVAKVCMNLPEEDSRYKRVKEHYLPALDEAYRRLDGWGFHQLMRGFKKGFPE